MGNIHIPRLRQSVLRSKAQEQSQSSSQGVMSTDFFMILFSTVLHLKLSRTFIFTSIGRWSVEWNTSSLERFYSLLDSWRRISWEILVPFILYTWTFEKLESFLSLSKGRNPLKLLGRKLRSDLQVYANFLLISCYFFSLSLSNLLLVLNFKIQSQFLSIFPLSTGAVNDSAAISFNLEIMSLLGFNSPLEISCLSKIDCLPFSCPCSFSLLFLAISQRSQDLLNLMMHALGLIMYLLSSSRFIWGLLTLLKLSPLIINVFLSPICIRLRRLEGREFNNKLN